MDKNKATVEYVGELIPTIGKEKMDEETTFLFAFSTLKNKLKKDKDYYESWKANIAMCMFDALKEGTGELFGQSIIPNILNKGADNFLKLLVK